MQTVLLADAAVSVRDVVKALLDREDVVFVEVDNATDAVIALEEQRPSLVILDFDLPPFGALEVLDRIRACDDVPVVILALREHALEARTFFGRGADEILLEPLDAWSLVSAAGAVLGPEAAEHPAQAARRA